MKLIRLYTIDQEYGYDCYEGLFKSITSAKAYMLNKAIKERLDYSVIYKKKIFTILPDVMEEKGGFYCWKNKSYPISPKLSVMYIDNREGLSTKPYELLSYNYEVIDTNNLT